MKKNKIKLKKNDDGNLVFSTGNIEDVIEIGFMREPQTSASKDYCIKNKIAISYTFNSNDPSMPICKANGFCEFKVEYEGENCCEYMHKVYEKEIKDD